ncbi:hypothetical protein D3C75_576920 [compost metagenome]
MDAGGVAGVVARLAAQLDQGDFHRVAEHAQPRAFRDFAQAVAVAGDVEQRAAALEAVARQRQVERFAGDEQLAHGHVVEGQGAGLVGADHRGRAERLDRRQVADQRVLPGHALGGHGQRQGHAGQQALGDVGDDDADGEDQVAPERQAQRLAEQEEQHADGHRQQRQLARQVDDLALQGRVALAAGLGQTGDFAELGVHAGGEHQGAAMTGYRRGTGQQQVGCAQPIGGLAGLGRSCLCQRLAGQGGQADAQAVGLEQPAVGRHAVAFLHQHHVAGHQLLGVQAGGAAVAQHGDLLRQQAGQRRHRPFGAVGLPEGETAVDEDDADDGRAEGGHALAGVVVFGEERHGRRQPQHQGEEVHELAGELPPQRLATNPLDAVETVLVAPALGFGRSQAAAAAVQAGEGVAGDELGDAHDRDPEAAVRTQPLWIHHRRWAARRKYGARANR